MTTSQNQDLHPTPDMPLVVPGLRHKKLSLVMTVAKERSFKQRQYVYKESGMYLYATTTHQQGRVLICSYYKGIKTVMPDFQLSGKHPVINT